MNKKTLKRIQKVKGQLGDLARMPARNLALALNPDALLQPSFLIIGTMRGGTTSLYHYLMSNPLFAPGRNKELHFFSTHYSRGLAWYRSRFPLAGAPGQFTGDASPSYLFHPLAAERVKADYPHIRLIALLRNPVDRAYSHWNFNTLIGKETLGFEEALDREAERLDGALERMLENPAPRQGSFNRFSYQARGLYAEQLERWFKHFPREQMLITRSEDLYAAPQAALDHAMAFLSAPSFTLRPDARARQQKPYEAPMRPDTRQGLVDYFRPHNQRLYDLLGRDFGWDR